jgi:hypothetical protein
VREEEEMIKAAGKFMTVVMLTAIVLAAAAPWAIAGGEPRVLTRMIGEVTLVGNGYVLAAEQKIEFIPDSQAKNEYATEVFDVDGNRIRPADIIKGNLLLVIGEMTPGVIRAGYIHLQVIE